MQEGMEGNPVAGTMKKFSRIIAILSIPILMGIEKVNSTLLPLLTLFDVDSKQWVFGQALFCYWLTSNLFTLGYGLGKSPISFHRVLKLEMKEFWCDIVYIINVCSTKTSWCEEALESTECWHLFFHRAAISAFAYSIFLWAAKRPKCCWSWRSSYAFLRRSSCVFFLRVIFECSREKNLQEFSSESENQNSGETTQRPKEEVTGSFCIFLFYVKVVLLELAEIL